MPAESHRPMPSVRDTIGWTGVALTRELKTWHTALPALVRSDAVFSLMLWVAVFSVAAAVVAVPGIPLPVRYSAGLAAVAYLFICVELTRIERPIRARPALFRRGPNRRAVSRSAHPGSRPAAAGALRDGGPPRTRRDPPRCVP